ncbi:hypothetical protein [Coleofasciculus sp. A1-SPW-01]
MFVRSCAVFADLPQITKMLKPILSSRSRIDGLIRLLLAKVEHLNISFP